MSIFYFLLTNQNISVTSCSQERRIMSDHTTSYHQPVKTAVSPRSSPLGTYRQEERLRLSDGNYILMT